jgi:predicted transcriptional regulator of viral defense system
MPDGMPDRLPPTFSAEQAGKLGVPEHTVRELHARGLIERIGRGLYRRADADPADIDLIEVAFRAPEATLCLETAMSRLDLSDLIPNRLDIAIYPDRRYPSVQVPVAWHKFDRATFGIGRETTPLDPATSIGIYSAERCIIDAIRLRHQIGNEVSYHAMRRYFRQPGARPRPLLTMVRHFPQAEPELRKIMEITLT